MLHISFSHAHSVRDGIVNIYQINFVNKISFSGPQFANFEYVYTR